jgi:hypothetical protein
MLIRVAWALLFVEGGRQSSIFILRTKPLLQRGKPPLKGRTLRAKLSRRLLLLLRASNPPAVLLIPEVGLFRAAVGQIAGGGLRKRSGAKRSVVLRARRAHA